MRHGISMEWTCAGVFQKRAKSDRKHGQTPLNRRSAVVMITLKGVDPGPCRRGCPVYGTADRYVTHLLYRGTQRERRRRYVRTLRKSNRRYMPGVAPGLRVLS